MCECGAQAEEMMGVECRVQRLGYLAGKAASTKPTAGAEQAEEMMGYG